MIDIRKLTNGTAVVGVVGANPEKARELVGSFEGLAFEKVIGLDDFNEAFLYAKEHRVDWIFCSFTDEKGVDVVGFLERLADDELSSETLVSCVFATKELTQLADAFTKGLFSWHPDKGILEYTRQSIWRLQRKIDEFDHTAAFIPYTYYRSYLKQKLAWSDIVRLAEVMAVSYPHEEVLKLHLVEGYIKTGDREKGVRLLNEVEFFDPGISSQISEMRKLILDDKPSPHQTLAERYRVASALLISDDTLLIQKCSDVFQQVGFTDVRVCRETEQAWQLLQTEKAAQIDFICLDWRLTKPRSLYLLQRVRQLGLHDVPVLVLCEEMDRDENFIVKEFGAFHTLRVSASKATFLMALSWTVVQSKEPSESLQLERKIVERIRKVDLNRARRYMDNYMKLSSRSPSRERYLQALIAYSENRLTQARYLLMEALDQTKDMHGDILYLLSRILLKSGDFHSARTHLKKVNQLSSKNISRLCALADAAIRLGDFSNASVVLSQAEKMDPNSPMVLRLEAHLAVFEGDQPRFKHYIDQCRDRRLVGVYLSSLANFLVKINELKRAESLLRNCIDVFSELESGLTAMYHLQLAFLYVKTEEINLARSQLATVQEMALEPSCQLAAQAEQNLKSQDPVEVDFIQAELIFDLEDELSSEFIEKYIAMSLEKPVKKRAFLLRGLVLHDRFHHVIKAVG